METPKLEAVVARSPNHNPSDTYPDEERLRRCKHRTEHHNWRSYETRYTWPEGDKHAEGNRES